ncbi:TIGR00645 family protein [Hartmannibacter diazotrophicus]|uniref:TIGR00645 family protein n=1 Tax=Hartmannibacter diazotrophicus TaxID=1482074 RepID=UPI000C149179|nr:TIGR00645 family protein [Hartmannibacter diazotrophicus]
MEKSVERIIFFSRWILAPFYIGLLVAALVLLYHFGVELFHFVTHSAGSKESDIILGILALIDLTLTCSLLLIVVFSGYENFVAKIDPEEHPGWPEWMSRIDFAGLKQKLMGSIVAISAIQVLKAFMNLQPGSDWTQLGWLVGIHMVFVVSAVLLAVTDRISGDH